MKKLLPLMLAVACSRPGVAPPLDQVTCPDDGGPCAPAPGVISGSVVYNGSARGDAILFLFDTAALPPPDGTATSAAALARVPEAVLFAGGGGGPFSAPFTFTQVPAGRSYQIRAFIDAAHEFDPFFDFTQAPRAGDPVGGYGAVDAHGNVRPGRIDVTDGQVVTGINVGLIGPLPYDPPSFVIDPGSLTIDAHYDQPQHLRLVTKKLKARGASFDHAHFALEFDLDSDGAHKHTYSDGMDDVFPRVLLKQLKKFDASNQLVPVDAGAGAIIPCQTVPTRVLPALLTLQPGAQPLAQDALDVLVHPFAFTEKGAPLPGVPRGLYQIVVIEKSGQVWTLPNSLGADERSVYYDQTQAEAVTIDNLVTPPQNSISGKITYNAPAKHTVIVQAYLADPANPPPPVGAARPVRVQIIPALAQSPGQGLGATVANYTLPGLITGQPYFVEALADLDDNFAPLNLLQTPTKGDLVGFVSDASNPLQPVPVVANGDVPGKDFSLLLPVPEDPPAFEVASGKPAQMPVDARAPVRFDLIAKPLSSYPLGAYASAVFDVQLVRDASGKTVDSDGDGLPDVWPRVFLVGLDASDSTDLTQRKGPDGKDVNDVVPAAIDPTPFLPALLAGSAVQVARVTVVARPTVINAATRQPLAFQDRIGKYKIVLISETGQIWQMPNEAGPQALDSSVVCASAPCAPGTVLTQSQGAAFEVLPPAVFSETKSITGTLDLSVAGHYSAAYVFAYDPDNPPPLGAPVSGAYVPFVEGVTTPAFELPGLAPAKDNAPAKYWVSALVDTRGDFALSPTLYAAAPGEGTLVAAPVSTPVDTTGLVLTPAIPLPPRPSFTVEGTPLFPDALTPQRLTLHAAKVLDGKAALSPEPDAPFFPASYRRCDAVTHLPADDDGDGLPDLYPKIAVVRLADADSSGLTPDAVAIPAAVDPSAFVEALGSCTSHTILPAAHLSIVLAPLAVHLPDLTPMPIPPGRYGVVLISSTGQVWRVPNELQPSLLDAASLAADPSLALQGYAVTIAAQVPPPLTGEIDVTVHVSSFTQPPGKLVVAAYDALEPPPPLGLGRPVAVQLVPVADNGDVHVPLRNLPAGNYLVAAMSDPLDDFSGLMSFMSTPPLGAQVAFSPGPVPQPVTVADTPVSAEISLTHDPLHTIPFERPSFAPASNAYAMSSATGTAVDVVLTPGVPVALPYPAPNGGAFHPIAVAQDSAHVCGSGSNHPYTSSQVYVTPLDTGSTLVPYVQIDNCQFCPSLTGSSDCSNALLGAPQSMVADLHVAVANLAIDPATKSPAGLPLPPGHYAITLIEPLGQSWTVPNELGLGDPNQPQGAVFTVTQ